jgi:hypothetical protein
MNQNLVNAAVLTASLCGVASADVWPNVWGDMVHVMIGVDQGGVHAHVDAAPDARVEMMRFPGEAYTGSAAVLDNRWYSSQYGWLADGFISLGAGERIVIENTAMDAGLGAYEGGMRMMRQMHTYSPIFGTDGSDAASEWAGTMRHDWFAATSLGEFDASFRVFVVDAAGARVDSYGQAEVTLRFVAVPAPGVFAGLAGAGLFAGRRRR